MKLTPRLAAIADMIESDPVASVADIGTDHAYLPIDLVQRGIVRSAVASDLNEGPLNRARQAIAMCDLDHKIELRLGSGLEPLAEGEVQCAVIAGMGGILMTSLLEQAEAVVRRLDYLVLQPMQAQSDLRLWLQSHGYKIAQARVVREGNKYYDLMKVVTGQMPPLTWEQEHLGINVAIDEDYKLFLAYRLKVQKQVIEGLERGKRLDELIAAKAAYHKIEALLQTVGGVDHEG